MNKINTKTKCKKENHRSTRRKHVNFFIFSRWEHLSNYCSKSETKKKYNFDYLKKMSTYQKTTQQPKQTQKINDKLAGNTCKKYYKRVNIVNK